MEARRLSDTPGSLERHSKAADIPDELCIDKQVAGIGNKHYSRRSQYDKLTKTYVPHVHPLSLFLRQKESGSNLQITSFTHHTSDFCTSNATDSSAITH
jgi:hypothetical protein